MITNLMLVLNLEIKFHIYLTNFVITYIPELNNLKTTFIILT
jgi:hypothetical protein